ncbi:MAG: UDP-N-acetylmuramoyl-L-alanine--D-glutamate ligase [Chromatiales bacterium]
MTDEQRQLAQKILIVGLGKTGMSVVRFLSAQGASSLAVTDTRDLPSVLDELKQNYPDVARFLGGFDEQAFAAAEQIIVSPGVSLQTPEIQQALQRGVSVVGDIELFAQYAQAPVVAITGSNGKSTVTTLVGEMAQAANIKVAVGGNIGIPALELLDDAVQLYVLELSSFQLETLYSLQPVAATVLNVSEDHMDRYDSLVQYAAVKAQIFRQAKVAVVNLDDELVSGMPVAGASIGFTLSAPAADNVYGVCREQGRGWICKGREKICPVADLRLAGSHNLANALAALALGEASGLPLTAMLTALQQFGGLPHRTQFIAEIGGVSWYNDSKATNVGASIAALRGFAGEGTGKTVIILGGECKDADFTELTPAVRQYCRAVVLIGRDADLIAEILPEEVPSYRATNLDAAVDVARQAALAGDRVLLSPACASFDMFNNFEHRGEQFVAAVRRLLS